MREVEIKLKIQDPAPFIQKIKESGFGEIEARHFEDNIIFDTKEGALRATSCLLRVRIINNSEGLITFKGKADYSEGVKSREEIESEVREPEKMMTIFQKLGLDITFRYQKYRTAFKKPGEELEILVDETPIGNYVELEGEADAIHKYSSVFGFSKEDYITGSYASLYFDWCKLNQITASQMVFP